MICFFYLTFQLFTMALTLLLLLLFLQDAQALCAKFLGLWKASALGIADSLRLVGLQVWKQHC